MDEIRRWISRTTRISITLDSLTSVPSKVSCRLDVNTKQKRPTSQPPPKESACSGVYISVSKLGTPYEHISKCSQMAMPLKKLLRMKYYALPTCVKGITTKVWRWRLIPGVTHRGDWFLMLSLEEMTRSWFQTNEGRRTKHTTPCSQAHMVGGWTERLSLLDSTKWRMKWPISNRPPVGYVTARRYYGLVG